MKVIIIPLETIVSTNFNTAIPKFIAAAGLPANQDPKPIISALMPLFPKFNTGELTEDQFKAEFLKVLPLKDLSQFDQIWNSMCVIDDSAKQIASLIATRNVPQDIQVVIYSDTNPIQFNFIKDQLKQSGLDFDRMYLSFQRGVLKDALLRKIMEDVKADQYAVVIGNSDKISDDQLRAMVKEKEKAVLDAAKGLEILRLTGSQLTVDDLHKLGLILISGSQSTLIAGIGALTITGTNDYRVTTISSGTINVDAGNITIPSLTISSGTGILIMDSSNNVPLSSGNTSPVLRFSQSALPAVTGPVPQGTEADVMQDAAPEQTSAAKFGSQN